MSEGHMGHMGHAGHGGKRLGIVQRGLLGELLESAVYDNYDTYALDKYVCIGKVNYTTIKKDK